MVWAMELVKGEKRVKEVSIYSDNQAAIMATGSDVPGSARHIIDMVHQQYRMLKKKHKRARVTIHWTPGHSDVAGNEKADEQAKRAAKGETSPLEQLPACLPKSLPISKAAVRRSFKKKLTAAAGECWKASPRYRKLARINPTLSIARFRKTVKDMPKHRTAKLVQLWTGHIALNAHLNRIGKADSPICQCCRRANETVEHFMMFCQTSRCCLRGREGERGRCGRCVQISADSVRASTKEKKENSQGEASKVPRGLTGAGP